MQIKVDDITVEFSVTADDPDVTKAMQVLLETFALYLCALAGQSPDQIKSATHEVAACLAGLTLEFLDTPKPKDDIPQRSISPIEN